MKALVKVSSEKGNLSLIEVPSPIINDDRVLVRVAYVGICGSDIHVWKATHSWKLKTPLILGHEFSGTVERVGKNVRNIKVGIRVVAETSASVCENCELCLSGSYNLCKSRLGHGALADGALCQYISVRPEIIHKLPKNISLRKGASTEPLCVVVQALMHKPLIRPGDRVAIIGPGTIGLFALQVAKLSSSQSVTVFGKQHDKKRLKIAHGLGASKVVNLDKMDGYETFFDSFDHVVDCSGSSESFLLSLDIVKIKGNIIKIGWGPGLMKMNLDKLVAKSLTISGSFSHVNSTWGKALKLLAEDKLNVNYLINNIYELKDWKKAFQDMASGRIIKAIIKI